MSTTTSNAHTAEDTKCLGGKGNSSRSRITTYTEEVKQMRGEKI